MHKTFEIVQFKINLSHYGRIGFLPNRNNVPFGIRKNVPCGIRKNVPSGIVDLVGPKVVLSKFYCKNGFTNDLSFRTVRMDLPFLTRCVVYFIIFLQEQIIRLVLAKRKKNFYFQNLSVVASIEQQLTITRFCGSSPIKTLFDQDYYNYNPLQFSHNLIDLFKVHSVLILRSKVVHTVHSPILHALFPLLPIRL